MEKAAISRLVLQKVYSQEKQPTTTAILNCYEARKEHWDDEDGEPIKMSELLVREKYGYQYLVTNKNMAWQLKFIDGSLIS